MTRKKTKISKVKVPLHYQPPGNRPRETLAYISPEERKMLLANTDGQANMTAQKLLSYYMDMGGDEGGIPSRTDDTTTQGGVKDSGGLGGSTGDGGFHGGGSSAGTDTHSVSSGGYGHDTGSNSIGGGGGLGADTGDHGFNTGGYTHDTGGVSDHGFGGDARDTLHYGGTPSVRDYGGVGNQIDTPGGLADSGRDGGMRVNGQGQTFGGVVDRGGTTSMSPDAAAAVAAATEAIHSHLDTAGFYGPGVPDSSYYGDVNNPRKGQYTAPGRGDQYPPNQTLNRPDTQAQVDRSYLGDVNTPFNTRASVQADIGHAIRGMSAPTEGSVAGVTSPTVNPPNQRMADQYYNQMPVPPSPEPERVVSIDPVRQAAYDPLSSIRRNLPQYTGNRAFTNRDMGDYSGVNIADIPDGSTPYPGADGVTSADIAGGPWGPGTLADRVPTAAPSTGSSVDPITGARGVDYQPNTIGGAVEGRIRQAIRNRINGGLVGGVTRLVTGHDIMRGDEAPSQGGMFGIGGTGGTYTGGPPHPDEGGYRGQDQYGRPVPKGSRTDVTSRGTVPVKPPPYVYQPPAWSYPKYSQAWAFRGQPDMFGGLY